MIYGGIMNKKIRQYIGLLCAVIAYYIIHEGSHLIYALLSGTFRSVNFMGLGVQIDIYRDMMTDIQLGIFCAVGSVATLIAAYVLVFLTGRIVKSGSRVFRACMYYITVAMLLIDPIYLSVLCGFFGGGDMNGISLLIPEIAARIIYGIILLINSAVFFRYVRQQYLHSFYKAGE